MATQLQQDAYIWLAEYADGSRIAEYDEERPDGRGWLEIEQERIKVVYLLNPDPNSTYSHRVLIPDGATPVCFRRRLISITPDGSGEGMRATAHCIGWRCGEEGVYLFVFDDGSSVLTSDLNAI